MPKTTLALALCRVSSFEQLESNSLNRQHDAVEHAAKLHNVTIPDDGWWSGSISSKRGTNIDRKDLREILERCRKDKRIKYVIVDEVDRFMRSMLEIGYFLVEFKRLGVKVIFASQPDLNTDTATDTLLLMLEAFKAEGSNEERQHKSISGQTKALKEGRYPFSPKPGYKRGYERGVQEVDDVRGPILRTILVKIASRLVTPTQALNELNRSAFVKGRAQYKMDKFRKIITDPFYAGIVEINKQVKVRNENGLHEPLITKEQHLLLVDIMDGKKKNQSGPRKNGNPKYPLSNEVSCDNCLDKTNGRFVGFDHGNGKSKTLRYEKYRCRSCGRYLTREELHQGVRTLFASTQLTSDGSHELVKALEIVWKQKEGEAAQETNRVQHKINALNLSIANQVEAATDPSNASIKNEILHSIAKKKDEVSELENQLETLSKKVENDEERFLTFAFDFANDMGDDFFEVSRENRLRCKELVFPNGLYVDENKKVYTPEISPLYRLRKNKKDLPKLEKSLLVRVQGL